MEVLDEFSALEADEIVQEGQDVENMDEDKSDDEEEDMDESDDMEDDEDEEASESEDAEDDSQVVSSDMLASWCNDAAKKSPGALKHLLLAFRAVARSDDGPNTYRVQSSKGEHIDSDTMVLMH